MCSESVRGITLWNSVEDSGTGGPSSITVRMEYLFTFQYWYCELCVENRLGEGKKHCFIKFCSFTVLELSVDEGWQGGLESLIKGQPKSHLFPAGILDEGISMTHSDISTGYFYFIFLWTIAVSDFRPLEI